MRLLIPILPLLAIASAVAAVEALERLPRAGRVLGRRLLLLATLALLVWTAGVRPPGVRPPGEAAKPGRTRYLAAAANALDRFLRQEGDLRATAVHPVYGFLRTLPADARLLMLNTNQGFFCDREYVADSFFEASQIADWLAPAASVTELRALLARERITHVLVDHRDRGVAYPPALFELLADPRQAELLYRSPDGRFSVAALADAGS